jgi:phosphate starvation-inducible PhoH-like protein
MTALHAVPQTGQGFTSFNLGQTKGQRFEARTQGQHNALEVCLNPAFPFVLLTGPAGTGKTLMGMASGMYLHDSRQHGISNVVLTRAAIAAENLGYLPGDEHEKTAPYMEAMLDLLPDVGKFAIQGMNIPDFIQTRAVAFLRGKTFHNTYVLLDEAQNCTQGLLELVCTRLGESSKLVICASENQCDLPHGQKSGLPWLTKLLESEWPGSIVRLTSADVQRSEAVRRFVAASERLKTAA